MYVCMHPHAAMQVLTFDWDSSTYRYALHKALQDFGGPLTVDGQEVEIELLVGSLELGYLKDHEAQRQPGIYNSTLPVFEAMVGSGVSLILGLVDSQTASTLLPLATFHQVPFITCTATATELNTYQYFLRMNIPSDDIQAQALLLTLRENQWKNDWKRAAIVQAPTGYSRGLAQEIEKLSVRNDVRITGHAVVESSSEELRQRLFALNAKEDVSVFILLLGRSQLETFVNASRNQTEFKSPGKWVGTGAADQMEGALPTDWGLLDRRDVAFLASDDLADNLGPYLKEMKKDHTLFRGFMGLNPRYCDAASDDPDARLTDFAGDCEVSWARLGIPPGTPFMKKTPIVYTTTRQVLQTAAAVLRAEAMRGPPTVEEDRRRRLQDNQGAFGWFFRSGSNTGSLVSRYRQRRYSIGNLFDRDRRGRGRDSEGVEDPTYEPPTPTPSFPISTPPFSLLLNSTTTPIPVGGFTSPISMPVHSPSPSPSPSPAGVFWMEETRTDYTLLDQIRVVVLTNQDRFDINHTKFINLTHLAAPGSDDADDLTVLRLNGKELLKSLEALGRRSKMTAPNVGGQGGMVGIALHSRHAQQLDSRRHPVLSLGSTETEKDPRCTSAVAMASPSPYGVRAASRNANVTGIFLLTNVQERPRGADEEEGPVSLSFPTVRTLHILEGGGGEVCLPETPVEPQWGQMALLNNTSQPEDCIVCSSVCFECLADHAQMLAVLHEIFSNKYNCALLQHWQQSPVAGLRANEDYDPEGFRELCGEGPFPSLKAADKEPPSEAQRVFAKLKPHEDICSKRGAGQMWGAVECRKQAEGEKAGHYIVHLANIGLSGPVPSSLRRLTHVGTINLSGNKFEGNPFDSLCPEGGAGLPPSLRSLHLSGNALVGDVGALSRCAGVSEGQAGGVGGYLNLTTLMLDSNDFRGDLPLKKGVFHLPVVERFDVSRNSEVTGKVEDIVGALHDKVVLLGLSDTQVSGKIPHDLGKKTELRVLRLASTRISGKVPNVFGSMGNLQELDLSGNWDTLERGPGLPSSLVDLLGEVCKNRTLTLSVDPHMFGCASGTEAPRWRTAEERGVYCKGIQEALDERKRVEEEGETGAWCGEERHSCDLCVPCNLGEQSTGLECEACPAGYASSLDFPARKKGRQCVSDLQFKCDSDPRDLWGLVVADRSPFSFELGGGRAFKEMREMDGLCCQCPPGQFSYEGSETCSLCLPGTFSETPGASGCDRCPSGLFEDFVGAGACRDCPDASVCAPNKEELQGNLKYRGDLAGGGNGALDALEKEEAEIPDFVDDDDDDEEEEMPWDFDRYASFFDMNLTEALMELQHTSLLSSICPSPKAGWFALSIQNWTRPSICPCVYQWLHSNGTSLSSCIPPPNYFAFLNESFEFPNQQQSEVPPFSASSTHHLRRLSEAVHSQTERLVSTLQHPLLSGWSLRNLTAVVANPAAPSSSLQTAAPRSLRKTEGPHAENSVIAACPGGSAVCLQGNVCGLNTTDAFCAACPKGYTKALLNDGCFECPHFGISLLKIAAVVLVVVVVGYLIVRLMVRNNEKKAFVVDQSMQVTIVKISFTWFEFTGLTLTLFWTHVRRVFPGASTEEGAFDLARRIFDPVIFSLDLNCLPDLTTNLGSAIPEHLHLLGAVLVPPIAFLVVIALSCISDTCSKRSRVGRSDSKSLAALVDDNSDSGQEKEKNSSSRWTQVRGVVSAVSAWMPFGRARQESGESKQSEGGGRVEEKAETAVVPSVFREVREQEEEDEREPLSPSRSRSRDTNEAHPPSTFSHQQQVAEAGEIVVVRQPPALQTFPSAPSSEALSLAGERERTVSIEAGGVNNSSSRRESGEKDDKRTRRLSTTSTVDVALGEENAQTTAEQQQEVKEGEQADQLRKRGEARKPSLFGLFSVMPSSTSLRRLSPPGSSAATKRGGAVTPAEGELTSTSEANSKRRKMRNRAEQEEERKRVGGAGSSWCVMDISAMIGTFVIAVYYLHPKISRIFLSNVHCKTLWVEGVEYNVLASNPQVDCYGPQHRPWLLVAAAGVVVWTVGIPVLFGILLFRNRKNLTKQSVILRYGFLFKHFKPSTYWWEIWVMARRILVRLPLALPAAIPDSPVQVIVLVNIAVVFLWVHAWFKPYAPTSYDHCNELELIALLSFFFTLLATTFLATMRGGWHEAGLTAHACFFAMAGIGLSLNVWYVVSALTWLCRPVLRSVAQTSKIPKRYTCCTWLTSGWHRRRSPQRNGLSMTRLGSTLSRRESLRLAKRAYMVGGSSSSSVNLEASEGGMRRLPRLDSDDDFEVPQGCFFRCLVDSEETRGGPEGTVREAKSRRGARRCVFAILGFLQWLFDNFCCLLGGLVCCSKRGWNLSGILRRLLLLQQNEIRLRSDSVLDTSDLTEVEIKFLGRLVSDAVIPHMRIIRSCMDLSLLQELLCAPLRRKMLRREVESLKDYLVNLEPAFLRDHHRRAGGVFTVQRLEALQTWGDHCGTARTLLKDRGPEESLRFKAAMVAPPSGFFGSLSGTGSAGDTHSHGAPRLESLTPAQILLRASISRDRDRDSLRSVSLPTLLPHPAAPQEEEEDRHLGATMEQSEVTEEGEREGQKETGVFAVSLERGVTLGGVSLGSLPSFSAYTGGDGDREQAEETTARFRPGGHSPLPTLPPQPSPFQIPTGTFEHSAEHQSEHTGAEQRESHAHIGGDTEDSPACCSIRSVKEEQHRHGGQGQAEEGEGGHGGNENAYGGRVGLMTTEPEVVPLHGDSPPPSLICSSSDSLTLPVSSRRQSRESMEEKGDGDRLDEAPVPSALSPEEVLMEEGHSCSIVVSRQIMPAAPSGETGRRAEGSQPSRGRRKTSFALFHQTPQSKSQTVSFHGNRTVSSSQGLTGGLGEGSRSGILRRHSSAAMSSLSVWGAMSDRYGKVRKSVRRLYEVTLLVRYAVRFVRAVEETAMSVRRIERPISSAASESVSTDVSQTQQLLQTTGGEGEGDGPSSPFPLERSGGDGPPSSPSAGGLEWKAACMTVEELQAELASHRVMRQIQLYKNLVDTRKKMEPVGEVGKGGMRKLGEGHECRPLIAEIEDWPREWKPYDAKLDRERKQVGAYDLLWRWRAMKRTGEPWRVTPLPFSSVSGSAGLGEV
uniref:Receptor ligand binding region domain-containing protein n=1 Tax=Chromera velia CCMP2878 TaxID=1169474 RepID=A0A0G4HBE6_9ALVE|eukprot:Cvel_932.t1-p1 / transcript=Cvel_932.t1 / gene=Cvel_932 / organism=Chromera_velia_CCMP2878 / gene_product=Probably inactive leucine-rich repeat receptor-like, putative / transcript_product=Probably inactive leucine-rich repeat receptor-like, putative / location=Cvel_scaffold29:140760-154047(-) / protein_length=3116 / sequence_SO=supercontig / SO=protein_coding / is_pseudo=false